MTGLNWLHLSDWHQAKRKFNRKVVLKALLEDIEGRDKIDLKLKRIDFIVFSGDAANAAQPEEYKDAIEDFFKPLLKACQLGRDRLFIVPGNHDLDRELIPAALQTLLLSNEEVEPWWSEEKKRRQLLQPFQAYNSFLTDCTGQKPPEYCNVGSFAVDGKTVSLIGINSAWMCARHKDEEEEVSDQGYLCIGEPQIYDSLEEISGSDIKIVVLHHPLDWLAPFDLSRNEVLIKRKCNFILHGHAHKPGASAIRDNFGYYIVIPAGACYDRSMAQNSAYTYSYNFVHLDFDRDKGIVFPRSWSDLNRIWRKDDEAFSTTNGEFHFSISGSEKAPIPHQIPPPPRDFKGRETEISDILSNFEKEATITGLRGMGGVGKTALALVIAERVRSRFPDGRIFIDMRGTSNNPNLPPLTPAEAMAHVIRAYRPADRLPESENELRGLYHSLLDGKSVLLLLDNSAGSEQVEPLLPPKGCGVLITSRIKFTLPGLAEKDLDILPLDEACEMLVEIAPRIEGRAEGLAETCGRLPLALRNAAKVLAERKDLSVPEYERRLTDKKARLELVKASFSLSYDLLTPFRKKHWRRLSVFSGDFDRDAARAVLKMDALASAEALSDLVRWSLVDFIHVADTGRYRLHDLARLFAESCLEGGELVDAQMKHAGHYSKVLSDAGALYKKGGQNLSTALKLFDLEWANIKAGQAWAKSIIEDAGKLKKNDLNSVMELADSYASEACDVLDLRLHPRESIGWLETGLKAAKLMKNRRAESIHLCNLGLAYADLGETLKAIGYQERSLNIIRRMGDRWREGIVLGNLGNAYYDLGKVPRAIEYHEEVLAIDREIGDLKGEGKALGNLGKAYSFLGKVRKAIEYYERAQAIFCEIGDRRSEGIALGNLGNRYNNLGDARKAIKYYEQALAISREIRDNRIEGAHLGNLGSAYFALGEVPKCIGYYKQALIISREIGDRRGEGARLDNLGLAYADLGETSKAIGFHEQALAIAKEIGDRQNEGEILCNLGKAYLDGNDTDKSIEYCRQSLDLVRKIEYRKFEGEALNTLGRAHAALGQLDLALDHCDQALKIFREIEFRRGEAEALFNRSLALDGLARREEAVACAKEALQIFQKIESPKAEKVRQKLIEWGATPQGS